MKMVSAVIKPFKLDNVREALSDLGVSGMTVTEVRGFGPQQGHAELCRGTEYAVEFMPKCQLHVAVRDDMTEPVIDAILGTARTGKAGDGKVFVAPIEHTVRIRTGEQDDAAL